MEGEAAIVLLWIVVIVVIGVLIFLYVYVIRKNGTPGPTGPAGPSYTVAQYGITGDGVTDWSSQLNSIINQASANGLGLIFPSGVYVIRNNVNLNKSGVQIQGLPGAIIRKTGACSINISATNCAVSDITIDGGQQGAANIILTSSYCTIDNVYVINSGSDGLALNGGTPSSTGDSTCQFHNITNCTFGGNSGVGLSLLNAGNTRIVNNLVINNGREGITLIGQSNRNILTSNRVHNNGVGAGAQGGIVLDWAFANILSANHVSSSSNATGINFTNATGPSFENTVSNNQLTDNGGYGIWLQYNSSASGGPFATTYTAVVNNGLHNNTNNSIQDDSGNTGNLVVNNIMQ